MSTTLATYLLLFPLWFNLTQQAPLTSKQLSIHGPTRLSEELAQVLRSGYEQLTIAERSRLVYEIRSDYGERAQQLLLEWLKAETDDFARAAILNALAATKLDSIPEGAVRPFLTAENALVQNAAMRLYGKLPAADFAYLATLLAESHNPGFQLAMLEALAKRGDETSRSFPAKTLLQFVNSPDQDIEAAALKAVLSRHDNQEPDVIHWQATAAESASVALRCAAASDAYVNADTPAEKLARDPEPAVRLAVFQSLQDGVPAEIQQLLALPADADPAVRAARVEMLGRLPELPDSPEVRRVLLEGFGDSWAQVRDAAEAVLSGANMPRALALELTEAALAADGDAARLIAYRQVAERKFAELLEAVRNRLPQETLSENLEAALHVITALAPRANPADLGYLQPYAEHRSPLVRAAAIEALGKLQVLGSEQIIINHALQESNLRVRAFAYEAMGFFPQRVFLPALAACYENRDGSEEAARARGAAAWAVARIRPETPKDHELIDQIAYSIYYFCTQATIPQGMGMLAFDTPAMICNGIVATTRLMKLYPDHEAIVENGKRLLAIYSTPPGEATPTSANGMNVPVEEVNRSVALQALQFLEGKECTQEPLVISDFAPLLSQIKSDE